MNAVAGAVSARPMPAGPRGRWILGCLGEMKRDLLGFYERAARMGDLVQFPIAWRVGALVSRPEWIEEVLVKQADNFTKHIGLRINKALFGDDLLVSEGAVWVRQRKMSAPAFQPRAVDGYAETIRACANAWADRLAARDGEVVDVYAAMTALSLDIAAKTLFGDDLGDDVREIGEGLDAFMASYLRRLFRFIRWPIWVPTPANLRARRAIARLNGVIGRLVQRRRDAGDHGQRGDLLSRLLDSRDDDDGSGLTERQLIDLSRTMLIAGHETTALTLTWTWHLLSRHPDARRELDAELDSTNAHINTNDLKFADAVIKESMRLRPPAYVVGREAIADCEIGGYSVPAGTTLFLSQWVTHRDARWFPEPMTFRPGRWLDGSTDDLPRGAYFPFGGGPRVCIGSGFAMNEAVAALAAIARRVELLPVSADEPGFKPSLTLRPDGPVRLRVRRV